MWKGINDYKIVGISVIIIVVVIISISYSKIQSTHQRNLEKFRVDMTEVTEKIKLLKADSIELKELKESVGNTKQNLLDSLVYLNPNVDPQIQEQIILSLMTECGKHKLPPLLALCIIKEESNFNPLANNSLNATGLMQVIPKYHQDKIDKQGWKPHEVFFIKNNIFLGCQILKDYFDRSDNIVKALQKYVGAVNKNNASKYLENIINNYITLEIKFFFKTPKIDPPVKQQSSNSVEDISPIR